MGDYEIMELYVISPLRYCINEIADHRPEDVFPALERSLENLGLEYLDLWLMHYPAATSDQGVLDIPYTETWSAMEECVKLGLARNIGISSMFSLILSHISIDARFFKEGSRNTTCILPN